jgi:hypothetical protein
MTVTRSLLFFGMAAVASATSVTFNFNSLPANDTAAQISTYMDGVLTAAGCTGCSVTVTGAVTDTTYNGENNVVGPGGQSLTLGTSTGATSNSSQTPSSTYNTFLATTSNSSSQISTQINMQFSGFTINGAVSFDYEIFPNGTCAVLNASQCGGNPVNGIYPNQPDFEFEAGSSSSVSPVTSFGTNGFQYGVTPSATGSDGSSTQAPNGTNVSPQYIGAWSGSLSNDTQLDFVDWPATIGVDNITVSWTTTGGTSPVPDPASVLLLGTVVAGIALRKKIRKPA